MNNRRIGLFHDLRFRMVMVLWGLLTLSNDIQSQNSTIDTIEIGAYISSIHNFDLINNSVSADIYLWCLYENDDYDFEHELEVLNSNNLVFSGSSLSDQNDKKMVLRQSNCGQSTKFLC